MSDAQESDDNDEDNDDGLDLSKYIEKDLSDDENKISESCEKSSRNDSSVENVSNPDLHLSKSPTSHKTDYDNESYVENEVHNFDEDDNEHSSKVADIVDDEETEDDDDDEIKIDHDKIMENDINMEKSNEKEKLIDEKLSADPVVVVQKMTESELEVYYDELRDKEIDRLLNFSNLIKKKNPPSHHSYPERHNVVRSKKTGKLMEIFNDNDKEPYSDDSNSDAENDVLTETEFLKRRNEDVKQQLLGTSSSDSDIQSEISDVDAMEDLTALSDFSSSNDSNDQPMVAKLIKEMDETGGNKSKKESLSEKEENSSEENDSHVSDSSSIHTDKMQLSDYDGLRTDTDSESDPNHEAEPVIEEEPEPEKDPQPENATDEISTTGAIIDPANVNCSDNKEIKEKESNLNVRDGDRIDIEENDKERKVSVYPRSFGIIKNLTTVKDFNMDDIVAASKKEDSNNSESDCEILDDVFLKRTTKHKSIEALIEDDTKRRKNSNSRSAEDPVVVSLDNSDSDLEEIATEADSQTRSIKPMLRQDQLAGETRIAQSQENARIRRLEKKNQLLTKIIKQSSNSSKELILDYNSETKTYIKVHPGLVNHLKPHQIDGLKFMYDSCYGGVDFLKKHPGSGCILAHCMGLGKTLQLIALLHTVISYDELKTSKILVLCPKSTVMNWADEIKRWLDPLKCKNLKVFSFMDTSDIKEKLKILQEWSSSGTPGSRKAGCLLLGYEAFRMLVVYHYNKRPQSMYTPKQIEQIRDKIQETLLEPGADLVICDEGHIIKNRKAAISSAVAEIKTTRRIILTGTPIQNNLKEYYSMVNFIKPSFLGTEKEFANLYANPIKNGQHKDSSKRDIKIMKQRSFVLHKKLSRFVQRREAKLLKTFLPDKYEYVLFVPMTDVQNALYEFFLETISKRETAKGKSLIPDYTCLRKIWTHPKVLESAWRNAIAKNRKEPKKSPTQEIHSDDEVPDDVYDNQSGILSVTQDWWRPKITPLDLESILPSKKLQTMFEILRMCEEVGDKCLIFSAFVAVLDVVEYFMRQINLQSDDCGICGLERFKGPWIKGEDYYRLDGKTSKKLRHEMVQNFNRPSDSKSARCFLISAKAGGQGINLIGANRVIILDTSWNPSNDQQNIFRVFRLGQKKKCYVYRLLAMGTMEEKVYSRSVTKQAMSFRVVDEQQIDRHFSMEELTELYSLTKPDYLERPVPTLPQDSILASLLRHHPHLVFKYHEHDSLLENKMEQELSEQEKADAWAAYERDLQQGQNPEFISPPMGSLPMLSQYANPLNYWSGYNARNYAMNWNGMNAQSGMMPSMPGMNFPPTSTNAIMNMLNMYQNFPVNESTLMSRSNPSTSHSLQSQYPTNMIPGNSNTVPLIGNLPGFNTLPNMSQSNAMATIHAPLYSSVPSSSGYNLPNSNLDTFGDFSRFFSPLGRTVNSSGGNPLTDNRSQRSKTPNSTSTVVTSNPAPPPPPPSQRSPVIPIPTTVAESIPTSVIMKPEFLSTKTSSQYLSNERGSPSTHVLLKNQGVTPTDQSSVSGGVVVRNSSPTVTGISNQRSSNMGIVYPDGIAPNTVTTTRTVVTTVPSKTVNSTSNISVRSVSSINSSNGMSTANRSSPLIRPILPSNISQQTTIQKADKNLLKSISNVNNPSTSKFSSATSNTALKNISTTNNTSASKFSSATNSTALNNISTTNPTTSKFSSVGSSNTLNNAISTTNTQGTSKFSTTTSNTNASKFPSNVDKSNTSKFNAPQNNSGASKLTTNNVTQVNTNVSHLMKGLKVASPNSKTPIYNITSQPLSLLKVPTTSNKTPSINLTPSLSRLAMSQAASLPTITSTSKIIGKGPSGSVTLSPVPNNSKSILPNKQLIMPPLVSTVSKVTKPNTHIIPISLTSTKTTSTQSKASKNVANKPTQLASIYKSSSGQLTIKNTQTKVTSQPTAASTTKNSLYTVQKKINRQGNNYSGEIPSSSALPSKRITIGNTQRTQSAPDLNVNPSRSQLHAAHQTALAKRNAALSSLLGRNSLSIRPVENISKYTGAGNSISPIIKIPATNSSIVGNRQGNISNTRAVISTPSSSAISNEKLPTTTRKRPATNSPIFLPENSPIHVRQIKKPRIATDSSFDKNVTESLLRAHQGLTILPRNMSQTTNQRLSKDGNLIFKKL